MVFQRTYYRVNTVWPPLLYWLLHPHSHTSDRIIRGVHILSKGPLGLLESLQRAKQQKELRKKDALGLRLKSTN